jgi:hypothetical protein
MTACTPTRHWQGLPQGMVRERQSVSDGDEGRKGCRTLPMVAPMNGEFLASLKEQKNMRALASDTCRQNSAASTAQHSTHEHTREED